MKLKKSILLNIIFVVVTFICSSLFAVEPVDDINFPLRATYNNVATLSHQELVKKIDDALIIDVRSEYEFSVLHISSATNVPITNLGFIPTLKILRAKNDRDIIFYCNGVTCKKSYKASVEAKKYGIANVFTFDLGVLNWAKLYPDKAVFFNLSPLNLEHLIKPEKFRRHLLLPKDFVKKISADSLLIDIREPYQRDQLILTETSVSAPLKKFERTIKLIKENGSTVLIYDAVGKQVRWLQYLLEKHNIENYYFMQGGVKAYLSADTDGS